MPKDELKQIIAPLQGNICPITGEPLDVINTPELFDTHRKKERAKDGGEYTLENTIVTLPRAHMEVHGNLRERDPWLDELKSVMDDRAQTMKLAMKINNQLLAYQRRVDEPNEDSIEFLTAQSAPFKKRLDQISRRVDKHIRASADPLVRACLGVTGLGSMTIAGMTVYADLEKANSASALWSYTGLHKASHDRYSKGETSGGNKTLRTIVWNMANSMVKNKACPYRLVYDRTKDRLAASEKIVKSRNNQGKLVEVMWRDAMASHRHGVALRAVMKHFLADYWFVGRELRGLDTRPLYVAEQLGHTGIISPADRGWVW